MIESKDIVSFPSAQDIMVNMMPIVMGDAQSVPEHLRGYVPTVDACSAFEPGKVVYLTVNESMVKAGHTQRRGGIHTDGTSGIGWGGGTWGSSTKLQAFGGGGDFGGRKPEPQSFGGGKFGGVKKPHPDFGGTRFGGGIYIASTDGDTRAWNTESHDVDHHGAMGAPDMPAIHTDANRLYHMCDRTPHEALPAQSDHYRQFFRLVGPDVSVWWAQHSTANPLGVQPDCKILTHSKFD